MFLLLRKPCNHRSALCSCPLAEPAQLLPPLPLRRQEPCGALPQCFPFLESRKLQGVSFLHSQNFSNRFKEQFCSFNCIFSLFFTIIRLKPVQTIMPLKAHCIEIKKQFLAYCKRIFFFKVNQQRNMPLLTETILKQQSSASMEH